MTKTRHLVGQKDVKALSLAPARLTNVSVGEHSVDVTLSLADDLAAIIRIESGGGLTGQGLVPGDLEAGPELGSALIALLGATVTEQDAHGLDLILSFGEGRQLRIYVDGSGYESYEVSMGDETFVASRASGA